MPQCAFKCCKSNYRNKNTAHGISYFKFPLDHSCREKWISIVSSERGEDFKPKKQSVICSLHFDKADIIGFASRCLLRKTAIPKYRIEPQLKNIRTLEKTTEMKDSLLEEGAQNLNCARFNSENVHQKSLQIQVSVKVEDENSNTDATIQNNCISVHPINNSCGVRENYPGEILIKGKEHLFHIRNILNDKPQVKGHTVVTEYTITTETILKAIEKQSRENIEEIDKALDIFCKNLYGRFQNVKLSFYDELVNKALKFWIFWHDSSPSFRSTPLMYKCYKCRKGWWRLQLFINHLKEHYLEHNLDIHLRSELIEDELNMVVFNELVSVAQVVEMDSNCWKCGREAAFHRQSETSARYKCPGCNRSIVSCAKLNEHEGKCVENIKLTCLKYNADASKGLSCVVCNIFCVNKEVLDAHMLDHHLARSDEPVAETAKVCKRCDGKFHMHKFHDCPARRTTQKCYGCLKTFPSPIFRKIHARFSKNSSVKSVVCGREMPQCSVLKHCLRRSKNYSLVYMCRKCDTEMLFINEKICDSHMKSHNGNFSAGPMLLPIKCLNGEIVKCERTITIPNKKLTNFLAGLEEFSSPNHMDINQREEIQTHLSTSPKITTDDIDLDKNVHFEPSKMALNSENLTEKDSARSAMLAQLDEDILRELEVEAEISKVFRESKVYRLMMEKEFKKKLEENESINKESKEKEVIVKNEDTWESGLIIVDNGVEDIAANTKSEGTAKRFHTEILNKNNIMDSNIASDNRKGKNPNDYNQDLDRETSITIKKEIVTDENELQIEPEVLQDEVKLETYEFTKIGTPAIADNNAVKTDKDVNFEPNSQFFKCKKCDYKGAWREYIVHICTECPGTDFSCNSCVRFRSLSDYLDHLTVHGHRPHSCPECKIQNSSSDELKLHVVSHILDLFIDASTPESQVLEYNCKKCRNSVLLEHFFRHWQGLCHASESIEDISLSSFNNNLNEYVMSKQLIEETLDILSEKPKRGDAKKHCIVCSKDVSKGMYLKRHLIEHLLCQVLKDQRKTKSRSLKCHFCSKEFPKVDEWKFHIREHSRMRVYNCELCSKRFGDSSNYLKHKQTHEDFPYKCDSCARKYRTRRDIIQHLQHYEHTLSCKICNLTFEKEAKQRKHMFIVHKERTKKLYPCMVCSERSKTYKENQQHMWIKHGYRKTPADCSFCDKRFRTAVEAVRHMKFEHEGAYTKDE